MIWATVAILLRLLLNTSALTHGLFTLRSIYPRFRGRQGDRKSRTRGGQGALETLTFLAATVIGLLPPFHVCCICSCTVTRVLLFAFAGMEGADEQGAVCAPRLKVYVIREVARQLGASPVSLAPLVDHAI